MLSSRGLGLNSLLRFLTINLFFFLKFSADHHEVAVVECDNTTIVVITNNSNTLTTVNNVTITATNVAAVVALATAIITETATIIIISNGKIRPQNRQKAVMRRTRVDSSGASVVSLFWNATTRRICLFHSTGISGPPLRVTRSGLRGPSRNAKRLVFFIILAVRGSYEITSGEKILILII